METKDKSTRKLSKAAQTRAWNMQTLMARPQAEKLDYCGWHLISYLSPKGEQCLAAFDRKNPKPYCNYVFRSNGDYKEYLDRIKTIAKREEERLQKLQEEAENKSKQYSKGKILVSTWGYEQTNVDFYQVLEVKGTMLVLQEIGKTVVKATQYLSGECVPDPTVKTGEPFRKKINKWGDISLETYKYCTPWDGKPQSFSSYA